MDILLFFKILLDGYKYHMGMCLFIFIGYLMNEFGFWKDEYSLWYVYGWTSLFIPIIMIVPMILMIRDSYERYKNIKTYYPNGFKDRDKK